jgi:hypothetical protein
MTDDWHASPALLTRFLVDPRAVDATTAASLEAHLIGCSHCRLALGTKADPAAVSASWDAIADRIDVPRPHAVQGLLARLGVDSAQARLLTATPALQTAGLGAVVLIAASAVFAARIADALGPFLVAAPLVPLATVAAAFAPSADPIGEVGVATPLNGLGLVVRRAVAALGVTFVILGLAALAVPGFGPHAAAWALPGLALAISALALGTWVRIEAAVAVLAAAWITVVCVVWFLSQREPLDDTAMFAIAGQVASLAVAGVAAVVALARRERFSTLEAFR